MTTMNEKRRAEITKVQIKKGIVVCDAADLDKQDRVYKAPFMRSATSEIVVPPVGATVVVEEMFDGETIISGILSTPKSSATDNQTLLDGTKKEGESVMHVFDRSGASETERVAVEYRDGGYEITADVQGDVTVKTGGDATLSAPTGQIVIEQGEQATPVLTENAVFEYEDSTISDTDTGGGSKSSTTKTTSTVSNGEITDVHID